MATNDKENKLPRAKQKNLLEQSYQRNTSQRFEDVVLSLISTNRQNQSNISTSSLVSPAVLQQKYSLPEAGDPHLEGNQPVYSKHSIEASEQQHGMLMKDLELVHSAVEPVPLRRKTFAVAGGIAELCETGCSKEKIHTNQEKGFAANVTHIDQGIPQIYLHPPPLETRSGGEFNHSLDDHVFLSPQDQEIVQAQGTASDAIDAKEIDVNVMETTVDDQLATSSFMFNPPLPSEDPRRCSTGVKVSSTAEFLVPHNIKKDLFGEISTNNTLGSSYSIVSKRVDQLSTESCVQDRLSTSMYVTDRWSSGDETYHVDSLSRSSCERKNHPHGSDHVGVDASLQGYCSNPVETLPSLDSASCSTTLHEGHQITEESLVRDFPTKGGDSGQQSVKHVAKTTVESKRRAVQISPSRRHKLSPPSKPRRLRVSPILKKSVALLKSPRHSKSSVQVPGSTATLSADVSHKSAVHDPKSGQEASASSARSRRSSSASLSSSLRIPCTPQSRLSLSTSAVRTSQKVAKRQMERSEFLFNTDAAISQGMNPDPFALSTTSDPFFSSSLYYDDAWMARQEKDMIKWLNALLTPPGELDISTDLPRINIADLWQQTCRQREVSFAPSREEVSSDLYQKQSRLQSLRRAAVSLLKSPNVMSVLLKVSAHVDKKLIMVREDRDLHLDVGLKHIVLDLLLCYNPLWLRIGLEAIFGRTVDLRSNSDIVGLATFIVHNLLSDQHIVKAYSHPTVPHLMLPDFQDAMKKFILKKFLFIVYFLDQAKVAKLIEHDPCLFMQSAKYKDSREILLAFSKEVLKGVGDITRHLAVVGYKLVVKQVFLDEFEYGVQTLQDLRDGVRLVRVMELILEDHSLSPKLRVPAVSKLQKIHNIDVALEALNNAGFVVCGDIQAKHLAEGHREKTLSFLWQIIHKFQAPRFTRAASVIQKWWCNVRLRLEIDRRVRARKKARFVSAAMKIQALWRASKAKRVMAVVKEEQAKEREDRHCAAVVLQKHWRRCMAQKMLARACHAANTIKAWYCGAVLTRKLHQDFLTKRKAIIKMQALCRGYLIRKKLIVLKQTVAARRIQTWYRRQRMAHLFSILSRHASEWIAENRVQKLACRTIQSWFRALMAMRRERAQYLTMRNASVVIQNHFRCWILMKRQRAHFLSMKSAAVTIQQKFRAVVAMRVQRAVFLKVKSSATLIQRRVVANITMKKEKAAFQAMRAAATIIQRYFRAYILMKRERCEFLLKRRQVIFVQHHYRAKLAMRTQRGEYLLLRDAAILLQQKYRAKKEMEHQRRIFLTLRSSAVVIQQRYRAITLMHHARCNYENLVRATVSVQQKWRALKAMSKHRSAFLQKRSAVIILQRRFRSLQVTKKCRQEFVKKRNAVVVVQQWWRAHLLMKQVKHSFQILTAVCKIQKSWRAQIAMRKERDAYRLLRSSTFIIQRKWKAVIASRRVREEYVVLKSAVIVVQRRWRAQQEMRHQREEFERLRSVCITIQRCWRSKLLMRRKHAEYLKLLNSVVVVQRKWRALSAEKKRLLAAVTIQKVEGATPASKVMMDCAAIQIQRYVRSYLARLRVRALREKSEEWIKLQDSAARKIQLAWRKWQNQQKEKALKEEAAAKIQAFWRGYKVRSSLNEEMKAQFERCKQAMQETKKELTLGVLCVKILSILGSSQESLGRVIQSLMTLDNITAISPLMCKMLVDGGVVQLLFNFLDRVNRSEGSKCACIKITSILVNLVKYDATAAAVWQDGNNVPILLHQMKVWIGKEDSIFLSCATIIWHFIQHTSPAQVVAAEPRLMQTLEHFAAKLKNCRKKLSVKKPNRLPSVKHTWFVHVKNSRPRTFENAFFSVSVIIKKLKLT